MSRRLIGRIHNGEYVRTSEEEQGSLSRKIDEDYYKGVKPSDLAQLNPQQLYEAAGKIHEALRMGTPEEQAKGAEALQEVYRERYRRRATIR